MSRGLDDLVYGWKARLGIARSSRVNRANMPNGFIYAPGLLWHGDEASKQTWVSGGFLLEPEDIASVGDVYLAATQEGHRQFLRACKDYHLQYQLLNDSDYDDALDRYDARTVALRDRPFPTKWYRRARTERGERYRLQRGEGQLKRQKLALFASRPIDTDTRRLRDRAALVSFYDETAEREERAIREEMLASLASAFPTCRVRPMSREDLALYYHDFLNPNSVSSHREQKLAGFDPSLSIQQNFLQGDGVTPSGLPGVAFNLDCFHHALFVIKQWPGVSRPGIVRALTNLGFLENAITVNVYPQDLDRVIREQEAVVRRLRMDAQTEGKESLSTQRDQAIAKVQDYESNRVLPYKLLYVIRLWHRTADGLAGRCKALRNALGSMSGALAYQITSPEAARQIFYQTWPGWTCGTYRHYDLPADDDYAAHVLPWSATFTGHLDRAEAIYNGTNGNLVGVTSEVGGTVQHAVVFGDTGSGKSVLMTDLLSQIGGFYDLQLIVDEGLSYGVYAKAIGGNPIVIQENSEETINYLDTGGTPLNAMHFSGASALCLEMMGEGGDRERMAVRQSLLIDALQQLYTDCYQDWRLENEDRAREIDRRAYAVRRLYKERMQGGENTLLDAFVELREWEADPSGDAQEFIAQASEEDITHFLNHPDTVRNGRDLVFAYFPAEAYPQHSALVEALLYDKIGSPDTRSERQKMGRLLKAWSRTGRCGRLVDGANTHRLDGHIIYYELGQIPKAAEDLKRVAYFLVANRGRQEIITRPRGARKLSLFEEAARIVELPNGESFITNFYNQLRKYNCWAVSVFQQPAALRNATVRSAIIGNSKMFIIGRQQFPESVDAIAEALTLSDAMQQTIKQYPAPEFLPEGERFSRFAYVADDLPRRIAGTAENHVCGPVLYASKSDGKLFDRRKRELARYPDIVDGIWEEGQPRSEAASSRSRPPTIEAETIPA